MAEAWEINKGRFWNDVMLEVYKDFKEFGKSQGYETVDIYGDRATGVHKGAKQCTGVVETNQKYEY